MARFLIQWCAPDAANEEYTKAIVDYIKGGKPMDEYPGFKVLARQIHPHTGGGALMVEADNLAAVRNTAVSGEQRWRSLERNSGLA